MPKKDEIIYAAPCSHTLYKKLYSMISRCHKAKNGTKTYRNYMGRGIKVCDEWRHDINRNGFNNFYYWAIAQRRRRRSHHEFAYTKTLLRPLLYQHRPEGRIRKAYLRLQHLPSKH